MNKRTLGVVLVMIGLVGSMQAATRVWLSSVGGLWTSTANWQDGLMPGANDAADLSAATGTIDLTADATVGEILYNPATGGGTPKVLTILSDTAAPSSRTINLATTRRIQVAEGAQLIVQADLKPNGNMYKDGEGTLVLGRKTSPPSTALTYFFVQGGRVISHGQMLNLSPRVGKPDRALPGMDPEFINEDLPNAQITGNTFLAMMSDQSNPGNGVFTQRGGYIEPGVNWGNRAAIGFAATGASAGGTGTYHLVGGTLRVVNNLALTLNNGYGVFRQSGGTADIDNFVPRLGQVHLTGGIFKPDRFDNKDSATCTFYLGGGRIEPKGAPTTSPVLTSPLVFSEIDGNTTFDVAAGITLTLSGASSGTGGFVKTGDGAVTLSGAGSYTGPVIVSNGTVNINQVMTGGNAVTVVGGNVNLGNVAVTYSSLTVTGGVFQVAANSALSLTGTEPRVRILGNGALRLQDGAYLPGVTILDVSESGNIDLSEGGTASVYHLVLNGVEQAPGLYTAATCDAITGSGTLMVNGGLWTGAGGDGLWSTGANWLAGVMPTDARAVADLSGAVSVGTPSATLLLDVGGLTNKFLVLDAGIAGATVTNASPAGVTNTLYMSALGEIHVSAGETLVLEHDLCLMGTLYKRGEGTLVLAGTTFALPSLVWGASTITLAVEAGTVVGCGAITNVLVMPGKPDRSAAGADPTFILADTPQTEIRGSTFLSAMSWLPTSRHPGNGTFTQLGGTIEPGIGWGRRAIIGFAVAGASSGGTGTYNLVNGMLRITNSFVLAENAGRGVFNQSGGMADIDSFEPQSGEVRLIGGVLQVDRFNNTKAASCTFFLGGGRLETKAFTTATPWLASPLVFTGDGGEMCFALEAGHTLTLSGATSGSGGFVKEGDGTLALTGSGTFSGLATVNGGTLTVSGGLSGTNDLLLLAGNLNVTSSGAAKLGTLAVTNGTVTLASGVMITAERFFVAGTEWPAGVYTAANCTTLTGDGMLIVGAEPGQWTGAGGDGLWSTAANWVANVLPNSPLLTADLSAAVSNEAPVATVVLDLVAVTNRQLVLASGVTGAIVTNASSQAMVSTLYLANDGVLEVAAGETLVLDHDLCIMGSVYKRGEGTLILRRSTYTLPSLVTPVSAIYLCVDGGKVITEGPMSNVLISVGKPSRHDDIETPEFIVADTPNASLSGTCFITALNRLASDPGPGIFTQNGGTVTPGINWGVRIALGHTAAYTDAIGTGTYNLVHGTLTVTNELHLGKSGPVLSGHYGIFNQSGGVADIERLAGTQGEINLSGGLFKLGTTHAAMGALALFRLGGGQIEPKESSWLVFRSPIVFTGENGDMTFASAAGRTVQLSVAAPSSGSGGFIKEGEGALYLSNTNAFTGTAALQEGSCVIADAGCLMECTNLLVGADALLDLRRSGAVLNTNMFLKVTSGGTVNLDFEGEVEVGHLVINGFEWPGRGTRYGSSQSLGEVDRVMDGTFTGTGVLKVVGPRGLQGTLIKLR